jgi:hypothetical protein
LDVDPKLSPLIVTLPPPVSAPLSTALLTAGASNVKTAMDVPDTESTVMIALRSTLASDADKQDTDVGVDHDVVPHGLKVPTAAVAL